jgi:ribonucleoside-diphosphate reductase alpha chain
MELEEEEMGATAANRSKNQLEGLSEKIFLDRYALKDPNPDHVKAGDTVLVLTKDDPKFPKKEVGVVSKREGNLLTVVLRNGEEVTAEADKTLKTLETTPEEMWNRLARTIAAVEATPEKQQEWTENFRSLLELSLIHI